MAEWKLSKRILEARDEIRGMRIELVDKKHFFRQRLTAYCQILLILCHFQAYILINNRYENGSEEHKSAQDTNLMVFAVMAVPTFLVVRSWFESEKEKGLREIDEENENEENDEKTSFEWYTGEIRSLKAEMEEADWWQWFINNVAIIVLTPLASVVLYSFFHILPMEPATRNTTVEEITD